jgi:hypothetical protein
MNNIVFVLIVITSNGHWMNPVIPTMEFTTRDKCEQAIRTFQNEAKSSSRGNVEMRCVGIEK